MPELLRKVFRRAAKPLVWIYYGLLYGRRLPLAAAADRWVQRWEETSGRGDVPIAAAGWDEQYRRGQWDVLREADEVARYGVLVGFIERLGGAGAILDVGCGEAILRDLLGEDRCRAYTGVDISRVAIERARQRHGESDALVVADAESYAPERSFDAVVLNECLYYFREPIAQARRYLGHVRDGGVLVVSMFHSARTAAILRGLARQLPLAEQVRVAGRKGAWSIAVFRPPARGEGR